jgi:regulator of cell morphogenesis and NO signaling
MKTGEHSRAIWSPKATFAVGLALTELRVKRTEVRKVGGQKEVNMNAIQDAVSGKTWNCPHDLIDHIVTAHHDHIRMMLPELEQFADRLDGEPDWAAAGRGQVESQLNELTDLLERHLTEQESWLFPLIRHLRDSDGETEWSYELDESLQWMMDRIACENEELLCHATQLLDSLRELARKKPEPLVADLIEQLQVLCTELPKHLRLERDVLFPSVTALIKEEGMADCGLW